MLQGLENPHAAEEDVRHEVRTLGAVVEEVERPPRGRRSPSLLLLQDRLGSRLVSITQQLRDARHHGSVQRMVAGSKVTAEIRKSLECLQAAQAHVHVLEELVGLRPRDGPTVGFVFAEVPDQLEYDLGPLAPSLAHRTREKCRRQLFHSDISASLLRMDPLACVASLHRDLSRWSRQLKAEQARLDADREAFRREVAESRRQLELAANQFARLPVFDELARVRPPPAGAGVRARTGGRTRWTLT